MNKIEYSMLSDAIALAVANVERTTTNDANLRQVAMYAIASVVNELTDVLDNALTGKETVELQYSAERFAINSLVMHSPELDRDTMREIANNFRTLARTINTTRDASLKAALTKTFTLFWSDGKRNIIHGDTMNNAFAAAGYGRGALAALDFWAAGDENSYQWDKQTRRWVKT